MASRPYPIQRPKMTQEPPHAPAGWDKTFALFAPDYHPDEYALALGLTRLVNIFSYNDSPWVSLMQKLTLEEVEEAITGIASDPDERERRIASIVAKYVEAGTDDPAALLLDVSPLRSLTAAERAVVFAVAFDRLADDDSPLETWFEALSYAASAAPDTQEVRDVIMNIEVRNRYGLGIH